MRSAAVALLGALLVVGVVALPGNMQSVTGPAVVVKPPSVASGADETVDRTVYEPVKALGLASFSPDARIALKPLMERTENRVREVLSELERGAIDQPAARAALDAVADEYRAALEDLVERR